MGPTCAVEQLAERHQLDISVETLRTGLLAEGVDHFRRRTRPHRAWRARKAHRGELVQLDGSQHDWLEGRGPQCVLMASIDDANSRVFARVSDHEGTLPALDSFQRYVRRYGLPRALYADKHTTYQLPAEPTVEEQLAGVEPASQFGRALQELGVELIAAHSPQAKGRVERLFKTFQDRLVKELRLARIATRETANRFLEEIYRSITGALWCRPPRRPICIGPSHRSETWPDVCASRPPAVCGRTSPSRMRGSSISFTTRCGPRTYRLKNGSMGHDGSRITDGRWAFTPSGRGLDRWRSPSYCLAPPGRSRRNQLIPGENGSCLHEKSSWRRP